MVNTYIALKAGLVEYCETTKEGMGSSYAYQLGVLTVLSGDMAEGSRHTKKYASERINSFIKRGHELIAAKANTPKPPIYPVSHIEEVPSHAGIGI